VASPSQGLGSRLLRAALKKAQFVDFGCRPITAGVLRSEPDWH
jgi:hypothetical protein